MRTHGIWLWALFCYHFPFDEAQRASHRIPYKRENLKKEKTKEKIKTKEKHDDLQKIKKKAVQKKTVQKKTKHTKEKRKKKTKRKDRRIRRESP